MPRAVGGAGALERPELEPNRARTRSPVSTCIGTPDGRSRVETAHALTALVNEAYGYRRVSDWDMQHRLRAGRNRVLHVAMSTDGRVVGCCSSTLFTPWCEPGCGHWGLLAVGVSHQGGGVAAALVEAAERRLATEGMRKVQMEYSYRLGDPLAERLLAWYEDSLGYRGPRSREKSGFRMCRKRLSGVAGGEGILRLAMRWLGSILLWLCCGQY